MDHLQYLFFLNFPFNKFMNCNYGQKGNCKFCNNQDHLNRFAGKTMSEVLSAAIEGTNQAYADEGRPTADLIVSELNETALGELFQMFMLSVVTYDLLRLHSLCPCFWSMVLPVCV